MSSTFSAPSATFSSTKLRALRARVNGGVFVPGDDGYDKARQTWNDTTFDQRPAVVVLPSISADVSSAVSFARDTIYRSRYKAADTDIRAPRTMRCS